VIRFRGRAVVYGEVWFDELPSQDAGVDIVVHRQRSAPVPEARSIPFLTLRSDLAPAEDALLRLCHENCRRRIKRADAKDQLQHEFTADVDGRLDEFTEFFDAFAREKSIWLADRGWLAAAAHSRQLVLSAARQGDKVLVWHAYLVAGDSTRLEYSASKFREEDADARALAGRANCWLHWQDMLRLKALGLRWYDWGGMFEDESTPERAGINRFKRGFGGQPDRRFDCTVPATLRGRLWLPLRDTWRRVRDARRSE